MNSFAFRQACEGALAALRKSAVRRAASTYLFYTVPIALILATCTIYLWRDRLPISTADLLGYAAILIIVSFIIHLSNKEIRTSLEQSRDSEKLLQTERQALEEIMSRRTQELVFTERQHLTELKRTAQFGELSQGLFHDLMNPLSSIAMYVEALDHSVGDSKEQRELVQKAVNVSQRMRTFMESVRKCLGDRNSGLLVADLSNEISTVRDVLAYKARMANVHIAVERCDPLTISAHPIRIYQLFLNLISNAIDACEASTRDNKRVEISVKRHDVRAVIEIQDNGCGMTDLELDSIFKKSFSKKRGGTGIGLLTVKSIVDDLGGTISVASSYNVGSKFSIQIPLPKLN